VRHNEIDSQSLAQGQSKERALELPAIDFHFATIDLATKRTQTACPRHTFDMFIDSGADALRSPFAPNNRRETIAGVEMSVPREVETSSAYRRSVDLGDSDVQLAAFLLR
jgi:hypothetical protein